MQTNKLISMRKILILLSAVTGMLTACQKEASLEDPNATPGGGSGGTTQTGLLTRNVFVAGADSIMVDYGYDAAKRLTTYTYATTGGGNSSKRIVRNSTGIITQYITKSEDLLSSNIDSTVTTLNYNAAQSRYTYGITVFEFQSIMYKDSSAFTYDGSGNLLAKTSYLSGGPAPYQAYQKTEYTYTAGNVSSEKYFSPNTTGTGWNLEATYNYVYDSKVNPVKLGTEAMIVLDDGSYFGNNNVTTLNFIDGTDPSGNFSLVTTYTYNNTNKPSGGTTVENPGSATYSLRYYYN